MTKPINLRQARKRKAREDKAKQAEANRIAARGHVAAAALGGDHGQEREQGGGRGHQAGAHAALARLDTDEDYVPAGPDGGPGDAMPASEPGISERPVDEQRLAELGF